MAGTLDVSSGADLYPSLGEVEPIGFESLGGEKEPKSANMDESEVPGAPPATTESIELLEGGPTRKLSDAERKQKEQTVFFDDNKRRIDFILTYSKSSLPEPQEGTDGDEGLEGRSSPLSSVQKKAAKRLAKRSTFLENFAKNGLDYEIQDCSESPDRETYFVKVHGQFNALLKGAEELLLRMPIRPNTIHAKSYREKFFDAVHIKDPLQVEAPEELEVGDYFTAPFKAERKNLYVGIENEEKFFSTAQRSAIVWHLMHQVQYGEDDDQVGIQRLLANGSFSDSFPLHESSYTVEEGQDITTDRQFLFYNWANWKKFYKEQPLDHVRRYFGEKVGIYFTWVGFYTGFLVPATIVGLIVMLYGLSTLVTSRNYLAFDICNSSNTDLFFMCPVCDSGCDFWYLTETCLFSRAALLFDNAATVFFAGFMALWAVMFLEFWKRRQFQLQYDWDMLGFESAEERARPEFEQKIKRYISRCKTDAAKKKFKVYNPVLEREEYIQPGHWFKPKLLLTFSVLFTMAGIVIAVVIGVLIYRVAVAGAIYRLVSNISGGPSVADLLVSISGACIQLVVILVMNKIYEYLAFQLTNWELQRTQTEYDDSFTLKMYIFQFVNYYSSLVYIAFFKGTLIGYPGNFNRLFGVFRLDECSTYGCMLELTIQLGIIFCGKQLLNDCTELGIPILKRIWRYIKRKEQTEEDIFTRWERDFELAPIGQQSLFYEYLELVLQYGFVTVFVAAFPLAPFFALLNNIIEIRLDAFKFITVFRRPVAERAQDIGVWYAILDFVSKLAVVSNSWLIAVTSSFIPHEVFRYVYSDTTTNFVNWTLGSFEMSSLVNDDSFPSPITSEILQFDVATDQELDILYLPYIDFDRLSNVTGTEIRNFTEESYQAFFTEENEGNYSCIFDLRVDSACTNNRANCRVQGTGECFKNDTICRFRGLVDDGGVLPLKYYQTLIARLAFVIVFEIGIFVIGIIIAAIIPDVPQSVENEIKREKLLALEAVQSRHEKGNLASLSPEHVAAA